MTATVRTRLRIPAPVIALTIATWLLATLTALVANAPAASAATWSSSSYASRLAQLVNNARAQQGLRPLSLASGISTVAASWTSHLASAGSLSHNPNIISDVQHHGAENANVVAENVGEGSPSDPDGLFNAYMHSSEHRANILDHEMRYLGIAVVYSGGRAWNTMDFVDVYSSGSSSVHHSTYHAATPAPRHAAAHHAASTRPRAQHAAPHHVAAPPRHRVTRRPASAAVPHPSATLRRAESVDVQAASGDVATSVAASDALAGPAETRSPALIVLAAGLVAALGGVHVRLRRRPIRH
jgi:uncharacterized protein YkwD